MSANEILAVVDEFDREIEQRTRAEIHASGLRHRAVHILLVNDQQHYFLQKRSSLKDINPGLWDTAAAGHVDAGEAYEHCAKREISEELGIVVKKPLQFLFKLPAQQKTGMEFVHVYQYAHNGPFELAPDEIESGAWFSKQAIKRWVLQDAPQLTETFKRLWQEFMRLY